MNMTQKQIMQLKKYGDSSLYIACISMLVCTNTYIETKIIQNLEFHFYKNKRKYVKPCQNYLKHALLMIWCCLQFFSEFDELQTSLCW